jgi:hypothetical protein
MMFDDRFTDWTDYELMKLAAKEMGRAVDFLTLGPNNDPFRLTGERTRRAEWLAGVWHDLGIGGGGTIHVRHIDYILVSHGNISWPKGGLYENTKEHWKEMSWAVRDARFMGLIPDDVFEERRADCQPSQRSKAFRTEDGWRRRWCSHRNAGASVTEGKEAA